MRIIGGHDYYDGGLAYGIDDAVTFLRNGDRRASTREMHEVHHLPNEACGARLGPVGKREYIWRGRHRLTGAEVRREGRTIEHVLEHADVVLCGTLHHGVHLHAREKYGCRPDIDERWIWTADGLRAYARDHDLELDEGGRADAKAHAGYMAGRVESPLRTLDEWFAPKILEGAARAALVEARITIAFRDPLDRYPPKNAAGDPLDWAIDQPGLRQMGFAKAVDPYTAFQEISMWKGGVLPSDGPPMVEIADERIRIEKAGFHHPTSFRRAKAGR